MSYLWHLDGLSMALGIGELDGCTRSWNTKCHSIFFLNTNNSNNTNVFWHTDFTLRILCSWCLNTRFFLNTNFTNNTNFIWHTALIFKHTDLTDLTDLEPSARCEWQLVVVVDSLWLLACCGYWLVVVIDLLCFKWQIKKDIREPCEALADPWDPCAK